MDQTTGDMRPSDPYFDQIPDTDTAAPYTGDAADIRAGDHTTYAELTERDAAGDVTGDESSSEIREDIEQTRSNMGETIDAIQARLSPERLTQQAKDAVYDATIGKVGQTMNDMTDTARESGYTLLDTIRQNPLPAALAGIGVGWLVMKVRENGQRRNASRYGGGYQQRYSPGYGGHYTGDYGQYGQYGRQYGDDRVSYRGARSGGGSNGPSLTDQAQDKLGQVSDKVTDTAQQVGGQIQGQAQQVANQAQYQAYRAKNWFERTMDENPLAIGLVAVAAGALAGMAVPETDQERQWMGPARDQLVEKAQDVAQDTAQKAQRVAQQAANAATNAAKSEAKNQNLVQ